MDSMFVFCGLCAGFFNGVVSRFLLKTAIPKEKSVFFAVWICGILYRLSFVVLSVFFLKNGQDADILSFAVPLIAAQEIFLAVPIKTKKNICSEKRKI